jgi:hypothetical protein
MLSTSTSGIRYENVFLLISPGFEFIFILIQTLNRENPIITFKPPRFL